MRVSCLRDSEDLGLREASSPYPLFLVSICSLKRAQESEFNMNAESFAENLLLCAPPMGKLLETGVSTAFAEECLGSYSCIPKSRISRQPTKHSIIDLLERFDVSKIQVTRVTFRSQVERMGDVLWFGNYQDDSPAGDDRLVVNSLTGEIEFRDAANPEAVVFFCAKDESSFLEALVVAARYLARCVWDVEFYENPEMRDKALAECVEAAGGSRYEPFARTLV